MKMCKGCSYYNFKENKCMLKCFKKKEFEICESFIGVIY